MEIDEVRALAADRSFRHLGSKPQPSFLNSVLTGAVILTGAVLLFAFGELAFAISQSASI